MGFDSLTDLSIDQLQNLITDAENQLSIKIASEPTYFPYQQLLAQFLSRSPYRGCARFSENDVYRVFKPWRLLTEARRREFVRSWERARKTLIKIGFESNSKLNTFLAPLVVESKRLERDLRFKSIIDTLNNVEDLIDQHFPGYLNSDAIEVLISRYKDADK